MAPVPCPSPQVLRTPTTVVNGPCQTCVWTAYFKRVERVLTGIDLSGPLTKCGGCGDSDDGMRLPPRPPFLLPLYAEDPSVPACGIVGMGTTMAEVDWVERRRRVGEWVADQRRRCLVQRIVEGLTPTATPALKAPDEEILGTDGSYSGTWLLPALSPLDHLRRLEW